MLPARKSGGHRQCDARQLVLATALSARWRAPPSQRRRSAEDSIYVPLLTYRTGAFAGSGTPIANGMADYLNMLNERDGGIGGVKLIVEECETGYDTKKGVECYESVKGKNPVVMNPYSTGITLQLIPKAAVDKIPILSMAYGLSASADGNDFPVGVQSARDLLGRRLGVRQYIGASEGGLDKLKGKKIGLIYLDAPYGKEPIPLLEATRQGLRLRAQALSGAGAEMQNQSALWLNVRRDRPTGSTMQGCGAMNPTAVKEAAKINYPMDHFIGNLVGRRATTTRAGRARTPRAISRSTSTRSGRTSR